MALNASEVKYEGGNRPDPLDPGAYPGRLVQLITLGKQEQQPFEGKQKPPQQEIYTTYEILDEFLKDEDGNDIEDKPRWISERFSFLSLNSDRATSTKRYFSLDPENEYGGDWAKVLGNPVMLNIVNKTVQSGKNKGNTYDKIGSTSAMRAKEAAKAPELKNPIKVFDHDDPDMEVFWSLPDWLQKVMTEDNLDYEGSLLEELVKAGKGKPSDDDKGKKSKSKEEPKEEDEEEDNEDW